MSEYLPKSKSLGANVKVVLDLSKLCNKADLRNAAHVDTSDFAKKKTDLANLKSDVHKLDIDKLKNASSGLSNLKSKVDKLDIGKLETTSVDLSKLSYLVKYVVKKTKYDESVKNVNINATDPSELVKKADYKTKINEIEKKITDDNHDKYITTQEFNKLKSYFITRLAQANLAFKSDISDFVKKSF